MPRPQQSTRRCRAGRGGARPCRPASSRRWGSSATQPAHREEASEPEPDKDSAPITSPKASAAEVRAGEERQASLVLGGSEAAAHRHFHRRPSPRVRSSPTGWLVSPQHAAQFEPAGSGSAALAACQPAADAAAPAARYALLRADTGRPDAPAAVSERHDGPVRQTVCTTACASRTARRATAGSADRACQRAGEGQGRTALRLHAARVAARRASRGCAFRSSGTARSASGGVECLPVTSPAASPGSSRRSPSALPSSRFSWDGRTCPDARPSRANLARRRRAPRPPRLAAPAPPPTLAADAPIAAGRGRLVVQTQPPGIKVLLDRKPVGETPLKIDVAPGRRILTFLTAGGEVLESVRVVAGKTETLDIPVFSGWVAVFAPIVLQVSADGRSLGTTEQNRLMLAPGQASAHVDQQGARLQLDAGGRDRAGRGQVNQHRTARHGEPQRGSMGGSVARRAEARRHAARQYAGPLGLREFVFKNPQFGERKISATIKAGPTSLVTVDFSK